MEASNNVEVKYRNPLHSGVVEKKKRRSTVTSFEDNSIRFSVKSSSDIVDISDWVDDTLSTCCMLCGKGFRANRCNLQCRTGRHHCRYCGILAVEGIDAR